MWLSLVGFLESEDGAVGCVFPRPKNTRPNRGQSPAQPLDPPCSASLLDCLYQFVLHAFLCCLTTLAGGCP